MMWLGLVVAEEVWNLPSYLVREPAVGRFAGFQGVGIFARKGILDKEFKLLPFSKVYEWVDEHTGYAMEYREFRFIPS